MAVSTGTATNHLDLLAKLRDFLVLNDWDVVGGVAAGAIAHDQYVSFKGTGLAGTDQIFLTIKTHTNNPAGIFSLQMRGHTAYNPSVPSDNPPGLSSPWVYLPLVNDTIQYWFVATGRRFIAVCKANNRYDILYGGFILPEHMPSDWAYPLLVGGSANALMAASTEGSNHRNFYSPTSGIAYLFTPSNLWRTIRQWDGSENVASADNQLISVDWHSQLVEPRLARTIDNTPWIREGRLAEYSTDNTQPQRYLGVYDGVLFTPSVGATIEQIIEHDGSDYLVVSNVFRNSDLSLAAIRLE